MGICMSPAKLSQDAFRRLSTAEQCGAQRGPGVLEAGGPEAHGGDQGLDEAQPRIPDRLVRPGGEALVPVVLPHPVDLRVCPGRLHIICARTGAYGASMGSSC